MSMPVPFGRKTITFTNGRAIVTQVMITEKASPGEDERQFVDRLLRNYPDKNGTIQIIFKNNRPDYATITFE